VPLLLFCIFVVAPAVELFVIIEVANAIGWGWTLLALLAAGALGSYVMRLAGASWWRALRGRTRAGADREPGGAAAAGIPAGMPDGAAAARAALLFLAGLLIFLPGFVSDAVGLLLLLPPVRALLQAATAAWFVRRFTSVTGPGGLRLWTRSDRVVRGQVIREDGGTSTTDPPSGPPRPSGDPGQLPPS